MTRFMAVISQEDIVNLSTGEIYAEAGDELDTKVLDKLRAAGVEELPVLDIDHVNTGRLHPQHAPRR